MMTKPQWHPVFPGESIQPNEVHVWRACLDVAEAQRESHLGLLSPDEVERAGRFRFETDQKRFVTARRMLRQILGRYLGKNPDKIQFEYTAYGKPLLDADTGSQDLCFNLSHSGAYALLAVTLDRKIGIDIERIRDNMTVDQIARRFFSQNEIRSLEQIPEDQRNELFFQYWARKEAFIKATGEGISFPMEQFDVSLLSGSGLSPVTFPGEKMDNTQWYVQDLFPVPGYAAAIAVEGGNGNLSCWEYAV